MKQNNGYPANDKSIVYYTQSAIFFSYLCAGYPRLGMRMGITSFVGSLVPQFGAAIPWDPSTVVWQCSWHALYPTSSDRCAGQKWHSSEHCGHHFLGVPDVYPLVN